MATTQSEDPNERVDHPRHYNQHPSGVECIELIEHLPTNLGNAVKYIWRCGLKATETPLRDLQSAYWYTNRELERIELYDLDVDDPPRTAILWRGIARKVIASDPNSTLGAYLSALVEYDTERPSSFAKQCLGDMRQALFQAIRELEAKNT
jgi:hypothetical protein